MIKINEDSKSKEVEKWLQQEFRKEKYRKMREDLKHFNGKILFSFTEDELEKLYQEDGLKLYKKLRTGPSNGVFLVDIRVAIFLHSLNFRFLVLYWNDCVIFHSCNFKQPWEC